MINVEKVEPSGIFTNYIFKAIPLAFDESMSYYETLAGLLSYLKDTILPAVNNNADALAEVQNLMTQLQEYVDNYFDNLDVQEEINNKLDAMAQDGTLTNLIGNYIDPLIQEQNDRIDNIDTKVDAVASGSPLVASSTSGMLDTTRVYVNTSDGKWYYYNGTTWVIGGTYQSTGIADKSITAEMLKTNALKNQNMLYLPSKYNMNSIKENSSNNFGLFSSGVVGASDGSRISTFNYMKFTKNPVFKPLTTNIDYFVNVYEEIDRQDGSFDFTTLSLELGSIDTAGNLVNTNYQVRTDDFITFESNTLFEPDANNYISYIFKYENDGNFIERFTIDQTHKTYTFNTGYKYKIVFQCNVNGYPITNDVDFYINSIQNSILTQMVEQVTNGWHDYTLTHTTNGNYLYKVCIRKKNIGPFSVNEKLNDYMFVSDDLTSPLQNKTIAVLGDSFSAFQNYQPSTNVPYYPAVGVTNYNEMWWQRLINNNGAKRGVIQASSGSNVSYIRGQNLCLSNTNMCQSLGTPDVIIIMGGTNDFSHTPALLGSYDGTGDFPTTNNNFSDAYALMLNRILTSYPNATVFCCGIPAFVRTNLDKTQPEQNSETNGEHKTIVDYSNKIKRIAEMFNCQYIDLNECGYNRTDYYPTYCQDSNTNPTHPNAKGQEVLFKCIEKKVLDVLSNLQ